MSLDFMNNNYTSFLNKVFKLIFNDYRTKVDLTKYIEEHNFTFDNVFDDSSDN